jgi:phosphotransferase system HPr-like phosphotransfer protein
LQSVLNDPQGRWIASHGVNRYRDWDELRYSVRSVEKHAASFRNRVQVVVNDINGTAQAKQVPHWLDLEAAGGQQIEIIAQSELFEAAKQQCLPTFNSLTMENQLFNLQSDVDHV